MWLALTYMLSACQRIARFDFPQLSKLLASFFDSFKSACSRVLRFSNPGQLVDMQLSVRFSVICCCELGVCVWASWGLMLV